MPDDDDIDEGGLPDDGSGGDTLVRLPRKDIRALEKKGKMADTLNAENEQLKRQLVFAQAGIPIDPSNEDAQTFIRGYAGELDPEKIRASAARFNLVSPPPAEPGTPGNPAPTAGDVPPLTLQAGEAELTDARRNLTAGQSGDTSLSTDPFQEAIAIGEAALKSGAKANEAFGAAINSIANAWANGDPRVRIERTSVQAVGDTG